MFPSNICNLISTDASKSLTTIQKIEKKQADKWKILSEDHRCPLLERKADWQEVDLWLSDDLQ